MDCWRMIERAVAVSFILAADVVECFVAKISGCKYCEPFLSSSDNDGNASRSDVLLSSTIEHSVLSARQRDDDCIQAIDDKIPRTSHLVLSLDKSCPA